MKTKQYPQCPMRRPESDFYAKRSAPDGLSPLCKFHQQDAVDRNYQRRRQMVAAHIEAREKRRA